MRNAEKKHEMNKAVLDASAFIALLHEEPGSLVVKNYAPQALMSAVNLSEVLVKLNSLKIPDLSVYTNVLTLIKEIIPFDTTQAITAASLITLTKPHGLSLADRACLSLAISHHLPVVTADKIWKKIKLPIDVILIR